MPLSDERLAGIRRIKTWQQLMDDDPLDVVFTLLDEVERLRKENEEGRWAYNLLKATEETQSAKLAKAREALRRIQQNNYAPWYNDKSQNADYNLARQSLKEISDE